MAIDVAWTPQALIVPAATRWLKPGGCIVSLLKPHYERAKMSPSARRSPLTDAEAQRVCLAVCEQLARRGRAVRAVARSPLRGKGGHIEFLVLLAGPPVRSG